MKAITFFPRSLIKAANLKWLALFEGFSHRVISVDLIKIHTGSALFISLQRKETVTCGCSKFVHGLIIFNKRPCPMGCLWFWSSCEKFEEILSTVLSSKRCSLWHNSCDCYLCGCLLTSGQHRRVCGLQPPPAPVSSTVAAIPEHSVTVYMRVRLTSTELFACSIA